MGLASQLFRLPLTDLIAKPMFYICYLLTGTSGVGVAGNTAAESSGIIKLSTADVSS